MDLSYLTVRLVFRMSSWINSWDGTHENLIIRDSFWFFDHWCVANKHLITVDITVVVILRIQVVPSWDVLITISLAFLVRQMQLLLIIRCILPRIIWELLIQRNHIILKFKLNSTMILSRFLNSVVIHFHLSSCSRIYPSLCIVRSLAELLLAIPILLRLLLCRWIQAVLLIAAEHILSLFRL